MKDGPESYSFTNIMQNVGFQDETPIQSNLLNKSLESAQKKIESFYFDTRKQLFEYDSLN